MKFKKPREDLLMPNYGMDTRGECQGYGWDAGFTHKKKRKEKVKYQIDVFYFKSIRELEEDLRIQ